MQAKIIGITSDGINNDTLTIECLESSKFQIGQRVDVYHLIEHATRQQQKMLWALLGYAIEGCGMKGMGYYSTDGLWENIKEWVRSEHKIDYGESFGMRTLKKIDVDLFIEFLMDEFFVGLCGIDVSQFFVEYEKFRAYADEKEKEGIEVTFRDYWNARGEK